jgi:hypothetical protein
MSLKENSAGAATGRGADEVAGNADGRVDGRVDGTGCEPSSDFTLFS